MSERILVCVANPTSALDLIKRGQQLAKAFDAKCHVLHVENKHYDEYSDGANKHYSYFSELCNDTNCDFHFVNKASKTISESIADVASDYSITQIVMGQPNTSKWKLLTRGSLVNELFNLLEGVDVHIVEVHREKMITLDDGYDPGINACLVCRNDEYQMITHTKSDGIEGVFYKQIATDFQHGIFKTEVENQEVLVRIREGVVNPKDVSSLKV
jgi:two-component system, OmpR family, sensor histidine kinase KdpD